MFDSKE
jgi:small GTP-binding protein